MSAMLMTIPEAAALLGIKLEQFEVLLKTGRGPAITRVSWKDRRVSSIDLETWLLSRRQAPGERWSDLQHRLRTETMLPTDTGKDTHAA